MILNVPAFLFVVLVLTIQNLMLFKILSVVISVLSLIQKVLLQVLQPLLKLALLLNRSRNSFLKLLTLVYKEVYIYMNKPTPAQIIQIVLDVLGAIGMALLTIFK